MRHVSSPLITVTSLSLSLSLTLSLSLSLLICNKRCLLSSPQRFNVSINKLNTITLYSAKRGKRGEEMQEVSSKVLHLVSKVGSQRLERRHRELVNVMPGGFRGLRGQTVVSEARVPVASRFNGGTDGGGTCGNVQ